jgi:hypothetical protein
MAPRASSTLSSGLKSRGGPARVRESRRA